MPDRTVFLLVVAICTVSHLHAQDGPTIQGWRTGGYLGMANMGGDYDVGAGFAFGGGFNFVPASGPLGIGLEYRLSLHSVDGDQLVLHQAVASPRFTNVTGGWYQYLGVDGIVTIWDFNYQAPQGMGFINHVQASGLGAGASAGLGGFTFGNIGLDFSASYSLLWFTNPRDPDLAIVSGAGRAGVLRLAAGLWFKGGG